jgi:hypothetical protein
MSDKDEPFELPDFGDEESVRDAFRRFLQGDETFDPTDFLKAAGLDVNPEQLRTMMAQLGNAFGQGGMLSPTAARDHAISVAKQGSTPLDPATSQAITTAAGVASLWLGEVTDIAELDRKSVV